MWAQRLDLVDGDFVSDNGLSPDLIFVFGETGSLAATDSVNGPLAKMVSKFPQAKFVGCSTGTSIDQGRLDESGITATMVGFEHTKLKSAIENLEDHDTVFALGEALARKLAGKDLKTVFVLSDGLGVNGSELVNGIVSTLGPEVNVSGGLAGDGAHFSQTFVVSGKGPRERIVKALGFYGDALKVGHGSAGGWFDFGPMRTITHSSGNVLYSLDNKPALELYERYLGEEASELPASGLHYPLRIWHPDNPTHEVVRTLLAIDREKGTMTFAGDVPVGWHARLMRGRIDNLIDGAAAAAKYAREDMGADVGDPSLAIAVSCVGRRLLMGQRTDDEILAVRSVIGDSAILTGFYSYGEIAPHSTSHQCGLHNQTMTITLFAEAS